MYLLTWIVVGAIVGWGAGRAFQGNGHGPLMDALMGIGGGVVGGIAMSSAGLSGFGGTILTSMGAAVAAALLTVLAAYMNGRRIYARQPKNAARLHVEDRKMKTFRSSILCLLALLLMGPLLHAQDLSKYRQFTLGMNVTNVLGLTEQRSTAVKMLHSRPALIQELTWWPPNVSGVSLRSESVEQIQFSFYNGELYKITVTYDRPSTEGLTERDMVKSISAKYGPATIVAPDVDSAMNGLYDSTQKSVASWEDGQYFFNLVRSSFNDVLGLVALSKKANAQAELAIAEAVKLDQQEGPKREADRQKKQTDDLEVARQKNQKSFRP